VPTVFVWYASNAVSAIAAKDLVRKNDIDVTILSMVQLALSAMVAWLASFTFTRIENEKSKKISLREHRKYYKLWTEVSPDWHHSLTVLELGLLTSAMTISTNTSFGLVGFFLTQCIKCLETPVLVCVARILAPKNSMVKLGLYSWIMLAGISFSLLAMFLEKSKRQTLELSSVLIVPALSVLCSGSRNVKAGYDNLITKSMQTSEAMMVMYQIMKSAFWVTAFVFLIQENENSLCTLRAQFNPDNRYRVLLSGIMMGVYTCCSWIVLKWTEPLIHSVLMSCKRASLLVLSQVVAVLTLNKSVPYYMIAGGITVVFCSHQFSKSVSQVKSTIGNTSSSSSRFRFEAALYFSVVILFWLCHSLGPTFISGCAENLSYRIRANHSSSSIFPVRRLVDSITSCMSTIPFRIGTPCDDGDPMTIIDRCDGHGQCWGTQKRLDLPPLKTDWWHPEKEVCGRNLGRKGRCSNFGDDLGAYLVEWLTGRKVEYDPTHFDILVVGSVVDYWIGQKPENRPDNIVFWGPGSKKAMLKRRSQGAPCYTFNAFRGPITRNAVADQGCDEKMQVLQKPVGDPALLVPLFYDPRDVLLYDSNSPAICIIPHILDYRKSNALLKFMKHLGLKNTGENFQGSHSSAIIPEFGFLNVKYLLHGSHDHINVRLIDIRTSKFRTFIDNLVDCEFVASSSLHGIILAEAYDVPWRRITFHRDNLVQNGRVFSVEQEGDLKYNDFGLSVGIPSVPNAMDFVEDSTLEDLMDIRPVEWPETRIENLYDPISLLQSCPFCDKETIDKMTTALENKIVRLK